LKKSRQGRKKSRLWGPFFAQKKRSQKLVRSHFDLGKWHEWGGNGMTTPFERKKVNGGRRGGWSPPRSQEGRAEKFT